MGKNETEKKMALRRTRNKLASNLDSLEEKKREYIEKAKEAYKRGEKHTYNLARSGLTATVTQAKRTREMLLNIDITMQMRDTSAITEQFLTGMETIFKRLIKINKSVDVKSARNGLKNAIMGMEGVQAQLDFMLEESEGAFESLAAGSSDSVTSAEIDRILGISTAADEEEEIGAQIDKMLNATEEKEEEKAVYKAGAPSYGSAYGGYPEESKEQTPAAEVPPSESGSKFKINSRYISEMLPLNLLDETESDSGIRAENEKELALNAIEAEKVLSELGVPAKVVSKVAGPAYSRLEMVMPTGTSVQKVEPLVADIAMRLGKSARFEVPIPGKNAFGIEVPNARREKIGLKELVASEEFASAKGGIKYCLAVDAERKPIIKDLTRAPHMIIAGSTGSGKSCFLHSMIASLMYKYTPSELKFAIVDFKRVEMAVYNGTPYLITDKVIDTDEDALELFNVLCDEMESRYEKLLGKGCRNIEEYNGKAGEYEKLPYIAVFVDEYADISTCPMSKEFDTVIRKLSQKARASGIHLVLATQRPSTDVISGTIKNNFPTQIAFKVARKEDSRTTLAGQSGAEALLGNGDMLYNEAAAAGLMRLQAPFVSNEESQRIVNYVKSHSARK